MKNWQDWTKIVVHKNFIGQNAVFALTDIHTDTLIGVYGGNIGIIELNGAKCTPGNTAQVYYDRNTDRLFHLRSEDSYEWEGISFINHNCHPNAKIVNQCAIVTIRDINREEEITVNYNEWNVIPEGIDCWCCTPPNKI